MLIQCDATRIEFREFGMRPDKTFGKRDEEMKVGGEKEMEMEMEVLPSWPLV
jgi:hypothetical protein